MRRAIVVAMILAVAVAAPVAAQDRLGDGVTVNALMGAGLAGTDTARFDMRASAGLKASNWLSFVGEWGTLSKATFRSVDGPVYDGTNAITGQHINGGLHLTSPEPLLFHLTPYATAGVGSFITSPGNVSQKRRSDLLFSVGGGLTYDIARWMGVSADYRRFIVDYGDPRIANRFTVGVTLGVR